MSTSHLSLVRFFFVRIFLCGWFAHITDGNINLLFDYSIFLVNWFPCQKLGHTADSGVVRWVGERRQIFYQYIRGEQWISMKISETLILPGLKQGDVSHRP